MHTIQIRALIFQENGLWCAQCLEYDIAAQASSIDELKSELISTLSSYIELANEEGKEPFAGIPPAPSHFFKKIKRAHELKAPIKILKASDAPNLVPNLRIFQYA